MDNLHFLGGEGRGKWKSAVIFKIYVGIGIVFVVVVVVICRYLGPIPLHCCRLKKERQVSVPSVLRPFSLEQAPPTGGGLFLFRARSCSFEKERKNIVLACPRKTRFVVRIKRFQGETHFYRKRELVEDDKKTKKKVSHSTEARRRRSV